MNIEQKNRFQIYYNIRCSEKGNLYTILNLDDVKRRGLKSYIIKNPHLDDYTKITFKRGKSSQGYLKRKFSNRFKNVGFLELLFEDEIKRKRYPIPNKILVVSYKEIYSRTKDFKYVVELIVNKVDKFSKR